MPRELPELEPGEVVRVYTPASFRGAAAVSSRSTFSLSSGRARLKHFGAWEEQARASGFPTAGPEMVLGLTDTHLIVWRTSFWSGRAVERMGEIALVDISDAVAVRHGMLTGLAFVLSNGAIIEVEAFRGRRLRELARLVRER